MKRILEEYRHLIGCFAKGAPIFLKYQILTKLLFSMLLLPLFWGITKLLIYSRGMGAVSNSHMAAFLLSPQGIIFLILGMVLLASGIFIEICGFITISAQVIHGQPESSYKALLKSNFKKLPQMLEFGGLILILYVAALAPFTKVGLRLSFLSRIRIPNFIAGVIEGNDAYGILYVLFLGLLTILSIRWIFTFHFMVIAQNAPSVAMRNSAKLLKGNLKAFLKHFLLVGLINLTLVGLVIGGWLLMLTMVTKSLDLAFSSNRVGVIMLLLLQNLVWGVGALLFIPFEIQHLSQIFYRFAEKKEEFHFLTTTCPLVPQKRKPSLLDRILKRRKTVIGLILLSVFLISLPLGIFFEEIFWQDTPKLMVGHRGGGGLDVPENSISSIQKSIEQRANYVEIDIQRSKDGVYILNHDENFKKMAGDSRKVVEMTLEEMKALDIGIHFPGYSGERVPTLEEVLDLCKGKVGLFIELKGKSADEQMADDVMAMVKQKKMKGEVVFISLDYDLIQYIRAKYSAASTGFVYFMAIGNGGNFDSDYIILEEDAATETAVDNIHEAKKKAIVWTVNEEEDMEKFVESEVDGIITDDVKGLKAVLGKRREKSTLDRIWSWFF